MKIYVATHKKIANPLPQNYEYMQVNAEKYGIFYPLHDALGDDQISVKNPYYCELTAAYWIWKNDHENNIVGLAHYRRFFTVNRFSSSPRQYLNSPKVEKLLKKYDFIATKLYKTNITQKELLFKSVKEKDFEILRETLCNLYPEYMTEFENVFRGHVSYLLNMFICRKELWDKYYEWLFSILTAMEPHVDMKGYSDQEKRLYGYLAERLFTIFVFHNRCKIKSYPTLIVGKSKWVILKEKIEKFLKWRD